MESERISIRVPSNLMRAAKAKAATAGLSVAEYARVLLERDTGVVGVMHPGVTGLSAKRRKAIGKKAAEARWGAADEKEAT